MEISRSWNATTVQVPSVQELTRLLAREDLLWCRATKIVQQSLAEKFLVFPAERFEQVFKDLLPQLPSSKENHEYTNIGSSGLLCV